ncbi:nucleotidyltransferase domain-containing protein [Nocardia tengchongensis]|uniref:nucleotidyltransferase domain-containing protein n=1 Tax=Nocardia tengchongensis TaxID=2055889 RepID=UPI003D16217E
MRADDVLAVHRACARAGLTIWIDGGWCVDALLGEQTRRPRRTAPMRGPSRPNSVSRCRIHTGSRRTVRAPLSPRAGSRCRR